MEEINVTSAETPVIRSESEVSADDQMWQEIIKMKLDGVMYHTVSFEDLYLHRQYGFSYLHKHHAVKEFRSYLCISKFYLEHFGKTVDVSGVKTPVINITGTMENALELYEEWEKKTYNKLKEYEEKVTEGKEEIECMIKDVKEELYCIRRIWDDIDKDKHEELNSWLIKKFWEC